MAIADATAESMLLDYSDFELSQLCSGNADSGSPGGVNLVTPELFRKAVLGEDISGEPQDVQDALNTAKSIFDRAILKANSYKNNELRGYDIYPDAEALIQGHVGAIARWHLGDKENIKAPDDTGIVSNIEGKYREAKTFFKAKTGCKPCDNSPVGDVNLDSPGNTYESLVDTPDQVFNDEFWKGFGTC